MNLKADEEKFLSESKRCKHCGHLNALHNDHCCDFCKVPGCRCQYGEIASEKDWNEENLREKERNDRE